MMNAKSKAEAEAEEEKESETSDGNERGILKRLGENYVYVFYPLIFFLIKFIL